MNTSLPSLPLAQPDEPVRYVVIDDEPRYRQGLGEPDDGPLLWAGGYGDVEQFLVQQARPFHVVVLDLCLNRQTGDTAMMQGAQAVRELVDGHGLRVLVHTADERPDPVAHCVAAGAVGYISKYMGDTAALTQAVEEIGRYGRIVTDELNQPLRELVAQCLDIRLSETQEKTLALLGRGLTDAEIAKRRHLAPRTIEDHKYRIKERLGTAMDPRGQGFAWLARQLGINPGDLVNDPAAQRPKTGKIRKALRRLIP